MYSVWIALLQLVGKINKFIIFTKRLTCKNSLCRFKQQLRCTPVLFRTNYYSIEIFSHGVTAISLTYHPHHAKLQVLPNNTQTCYICLPLCEHHFWGVHDFFHQGNKLVSNQKFFFVFSVREPSKNYFVISRHHFSSLAYIYMHKYFWPLTSFE